MGDGPWLYHACMAPSPAQNEDQAVQARLELALDVAQAVGERTVHYFRQRGLGADQKQDGSPVTVADREAEAEIRAAIERAFADDEILGEEFGEKPGRSGFRWVLDPIDGTKSFVRGVPLYGLLIAVERDGESIIGIIHMPVLHESVHAVIGSGAWHRVAGSMRGSEVPARVSGVNELSEALICTTSFSYGVKHYSQGFTRLAERCRSMRGWSDCYGHLLVATGRAEAAVEPLINVWDVAPMIPIMREAGGTYTDWAGRVTALSPTGLSSNGRVHESILSILRVPAAGDD